jgi:hypothetical protein
MLKHVVEQKITSISGPASQQQDAAQFLQCGTLG